MTILSTTIKESSFNPLSYTSLQAPELAATIAYINEEQVEELLGFLRAFTTLSANEINNLNVNLSAIYAEGVILQVQPKDLKNSVADSKATYFITFDSPITQLEDLQTQYILLKQKADEKLGEKTIKLAKQTFTVQDRYKVSKNMLRLELHSPNDFDQNTANHHTKSVSSPVPIDEPGYAYLFDLEHNRRTTDKMKKINKPRPHCYYTLRKAWHTANGTQAWVDVFLHGDTSGGLWAESLHIGDHVVTKREVPERIEHLHRGQALLIADETSIPTVARLLELWDNPLPPLVLSITQDESDQDYFAQVKMNAKILGDFTVVPLVTGKVNAGRGLASLIDNELGHYLAYQNIVIDKVWGALEANTAKALRGLLKQRLHLERCDMVIKVYWRHD
mgnify:CR=1 FL=1